MGIFGSFLLAQIHQRQRERNPKNIENVLLGLAGAMGPRACAGSLVPYSPLSSGFQSSCVRDVRAHPCFQDPFLDLIFFEHADTFCHGMAAGVAILLLGV